MRADRAWVRLSPSGRPLNLLNPDPKAWEDADLAVGLSRTYRWGGHSAWELPLSVAQHSLTVLAIRKAEPGQPLTEAEQLRELLHDADEGFLSNRISARVITGWSNVCRPPLSPAIDCPLGPPRNTPATKRPTGWLPPAKHCMSSAGAPMTSGTRWKSTCRP